MWHRYRAGEDYKPGLNVYLSCNGFALHWMSPYWQRTWSMFLRWSWRPGFKSYVVHFS